MSTSNIEKISDHFKLPIFYNENKMEINKNIVNDLELIKTIDSSYNPLYQYAFQPKTKVGIKLIEQISNYYTTDVQFLKDSQHLLTSYKKIKFDDNESNREKVEDKYEKIIEIWDEIKNDTGFKERYHYIDWPRWEYLNKSDYFLQIMSIYNLISPVISLCVPFIILIIPFFVIHIKGLNVTVSEYIDILKTIISNHAIGKLFTKFNSVKLDEKVYILLSAAFYVFSIYQNILTCYRFNKNMKKIHEHLFFIKKYIEQTEESMSNILLYTSNLKTYSKFNETIQEKLVILSKLKNQLDLIKPYTFSTSKLGQFGIVMKHFYDIYNDTTYNDAFLYSFGFNAYVDNIEGLIENINKGNIHLAKFTTKKKKNFFKKSFYPPLINNKPVKNSFNFKKNLIITGPNASGKTTTLKSALINVIITQQFGCGFYQEAILNPYKYIHCYLNIPDTSGRDSLFQAEARRCKEIIDIININSKKDTHFCVFDELYSGTNPEEAIISAHAFMQYLLKFNNVNCILTTHFFDLCYKLNKNDEIENYHMKTEKNGKDFKYTYLLKKGISTVRGGIKVLNDMNYPKEIIENTLKSA